MTAIFCGGCRGANWRPPRRLGKSTHHPPPRKVESHQPFPGVFAFCLGSRAGRTRPDGVPFRRLVELALTSGRSPAQRHSRACPALPTLARAPVVPLSVPTPALTSPPLSLCPLAPSAPAARAARSRPLLAPSARAARSRRTLVPPARAVRSRLTLFPHAPRSRSARTSLSLHHVRGACPARASLSSLQGRWFRCRVCREGEEDGEKSCGRQSRGRRSPGRRSRVRGARG